MMPQTPYSLLFLKRLSFSSQPLNAHLSASLLSHLLTNRTSQRFSTSHVSSTASSSSSDPKPTSLSSRMSFIFDQIDAIEKERSQKDQTLQRIRAWRESKTIRDPPVDDRKPGLVSGTVDGGGNANSLESTSEIDQLKELQVRMKKKNEMELVHPWPEWIELMERLVHQNYFDHRRKDEDKMAEELGFGGSELALEEDVGFDLSKDFMAVHTACLNFGKDRFDILRSLPRKDIQLLVGFGCPSPDKKVVFSAKLLRKLVHLDEGDVCSSCSLRNSCERAYLLTNKEDEARTIDIMRLLFTFGFDPSNGSVVNGSLLNRKSVKTVVRKLLHEVVKLSAVPIDPNLTPPVIKKPPPKVKQPPPPPKRRVGRDDVEMKKGDWLCPKCDFMNFAKNTICLQCDAKRPKRQLLPGEWECPQCNFLNYRRNMACFHCECKRPADTFVDNERESKQHMPPLRLEKISKRQEVSNAWNFDFDDDESDGADVAAFEHADSAVAREGSPLDNEVRESKFSRDLPENGFYNTGNRRPGVGFDDFVDEEDDIDSYELDTSMSNSERRPHSIDFSDIEERSGSDDVSDSDIRSSVPTYAKNSKKIHRKSSFSDTEDDDELALDSDDDNSMKQDWKSSHLARPRQKRGSGPSAQSRRLSHGSDEELGLDSDADEDFGRMSRSRSMRGNTAGSSRRHFHRRGSPGKAGSDFDDIDSSHGHRSRGNQRGSYRGGRDSRDGGEKFTRGREFQSKSFGNGRKNTFEKSPRGRGAYNEFKKQRPGRRYNEYGSGSAIDDDRGEFRNSRRVIER